MFIIQDVNGLYNLSEAKSGLLIASESSKKKLMEKAKEIINKYGIKRINENILYMTNKFDIGISPKYRDV